ncbi:MAG: hypothetical protein QM831_45485 [Kofleriaceae bacterium]
MRWVWLLCVACGRIDFDPFARTPDAHTDAPTDSGRVCGAFETPALIGGDVMSAFDDWEPTVAPDGTLAFTSNRVMNIDTLYISKPPYTVATVPSIDNTAINQWGPVWNADGSRLYFSRDLAGTTATMYSADFDGTTFTNLRNEQGLDNQTIRGAAISHDELELIYGDDDDAAQARLVRARRMNVGDPWTIEGALPAPLNQGGDSYGAFTRDDLTFVWETQREGAARLYQATRTSRSDEFANVMPFDLVAHVAGDDGDPDFSDGDQRFAFASSRNGNSTGNDIYITTRTCQ